ncbi:hypothetical protein [Nocardia sp. CC227C]|uniref:hypothetical protein n=1 Tax=Nocardia sp. CC227C TaxID=3044562 RepID=UPI00278C4904|nr:hypothetical protein [Nocardia sp. CC227C]
MSEYLRYLLASHVDCSVVCDRYCSCGVQHPDGYAAHLAEVIDQFVLVVPRGEVDGVEYGWRARPGDRVHPRDDRGAALLTAQRRGGEGVERAALAWTPLPEETGDD